MLKIKCRLFVLVYLILYESFLSAALSEARCQVSSDDSGFRIVAQALLTKSGLVYTARQDILWTANVNSTDSAQVVVDLRCAGMKSRQVYCFPPEAQGRIILDNGKQCSIYDMRHGMLLTAPSSSEDMWSATPETLQLLRANYVCSLTHREELNGLTCDVVRIRHRGTNVPSKICWIDEVHHSILRVEDYDTQWNRRYVSSYEAIHFFSRLPPGALLVPTSAQHVTKRGAILETIEPSAAQAFVATDIAGTVPAWSPPGFVLIHSAVIRYPAGNRVVALHYSDGLKSLVVVEEQRRSDGPSQSEVNQALGRYGQQAWINDRGNMRLIVRGDLSLPPNVGPDMVAALSSASEAKLSKAVDHDFGPLAARQASALRRNGWDYCQIGALCLWEQEHPHAIKRIKSLMTNSAAWPRFEHVLGGDVHSLEARTHAWVAIVVSH